MKAFRRMMKSRSWLVQEDCGNTFWTITFGTGHTVETEKPQQKEAQQGDERTTSDHCLYIIVVIIKCWKNNNK
jgi:hypothetical protein